MASENKIITIGEAQALLPGAFPSASGDELKRCPMKSELLANGFSITGTTRTYEDNQTVVASDLGGYDVTYVLSNVSVVYSTSPYTNMIFAGGSNYAYVKADVTKLIGGVPVSGITDVTLESVKVSGEGFSVSASTYIKAADRKMVTGDTRDGVFYGVYSDSVGISARTSNVTATQAANTSTDMEYTTSFSYRNLAPVSSVPGSGVYGYQGRELVSSDQGRYYAQCNRSYKYWTSYSSGSNTPTGTTSSIVTAETYTFETSVTWAMVYSSDLKQFTVNQNVGDTNRTATTVTAQYDGKTSTFTLEQWRSPSSSTQTRVTNVSPNSLFWGYNEYGTSYAKEVTATFQYAISTWKNGTTTTGSWTNYTPATPGGSLVPFARTDGQYGSHFKFYKYDGTTGAEQMDFYYESQSSSQGKIRIYPYDANTTVVTKSSNVVQYYTNPTSSIATLSHEGTIPFSIDPTSLSFASGGGTKVITVTTEAENWTVSENAGWFTAAKNGNEVTVVVDTNTNTANSRSDYVRFMSGTTEITNCKVTQEPAPIPEPSIPGISKLFALDNTGWIVGRYIVSTSQTPYVYQIVIVRETPGDDIHFSFGSDGYYETHSQSETVKHNWIDPPLVTYGIDYKSGTTFHTTDATGTVIDCYGVSIAGAIGQNAETGSSYAKITYEYV